MHLSITCINNFLNLILQIKFRCYLRKNIYKHYFSSFLFFLPYSRWLLSSKQEMDKKLSSRRTGRSRPESGTVSKQHYRPRDVLAPATQGELPLEASHLSGCTLQISHAKSAPRRETNGEKKKSWRGTRRVNKRFDERVRIQMKAKIERVCSVQSFANVRQYRRVFHSPHLLACSFW